MGGVTPPTTPSSDGPAGGIKWLITSPCTNESGAVCANGFPIHARFRRFSPGSPVSPFKYFNVVLYVMLMFGPFGNKSHDFKVILGACLNKVINNY